LKREENGRPGFSIVIPARDEERYLPICLDSIERAASACHARVEVIVVVNRCTDRTEQIARERGAVVVRNDARCLAAIRNAGARAASNDILVTIDADSAMSPGLLADIDRCLASGRYVGGGTRFVFDRFSLGLWLLLLLVTPLIVLLNIASGCLWCRRRDFVRLGGFDERRIAWEDVDFARRLKRLGRSQGRRFKVLLRSPIRTSARKFALLRDDPRLLFRMLRGIDAATADLLWYETPRGHPQRTRRSRTRS
jgi:glycosyltransferase involved in cell wall biosynthesis